MTTKVEIYFGGTATDVSSYTRSVSVSRGRSDEIAQFTTGNSVVVLENRDRRFDPLYSQGPYFGFIKPRIRLVVSKDSISLFDGFVDDWDYNYDVSSQSTTTVICIDGMGLLSQTALSEYTNTQQNPAERITTVINRDEVSYQGSTNLDGGLTALVADTVSSNTNTISYLQTVSDTDLGRLFVDGSGVLRYRSRTDGVAQNAKVVFCDPNDEYLAQLQLLSSSTLWFDASSPEPVRNDGSEVSLGQIELQDATLWFDASDPEYVPPLVPFQGVEVEYGTERLYNRVSITRSGGTAVIVANDEDSQSEYSIRNFGEQDLLFIDDVTAQNYANYLLTIYAEPETRIVSHTVQLESVSETVQRYLMRLEIGDVVRTIWAPNEVGEALDVDSLIEAVQHSMVPGSHRMTVRLVPRDRRGFILDSLTDGLLDTSEMTY